MPTEWKIEIAIIMMRKKKFCNNNIKFNTEFETNCEHTNNEWSGCLCFTAVLIDTLFWFGMILVTIDGSNYLHLGAKQYTYISEVVRLYYIELIVDTIGMNSIGIDELTLFCFPFHPSFDLFTICKQRYRSLIFEVSYNSCILCCSMA